MSTRIISGYLKGSVLTVPNSARPTLVRSRRSLFDILEGSSLVSEKPSLFFENKIVIDCFAGSGALGIEALSRGASFSYFIDISQNAINVINSNIQKLKLKNCYKIIKTDILKIGKFKNSQQCDIAFIDPPYGKVSIKKTINQLHDMHWLKDTAVIVTEEDCSNLEDLSIFGPSIIERKLGNSFFRIIKGAIQPINS